MSSSIIDRETVFEFNDLDHGRWFFLIDDLATAARALGYEPQSCELTRHHYEHVSRNNGVDLEYVALITPEQRDVPAIICDWEDGSHTLIDGNHRMCRRWEDGFTNFDAYILPIGLLRGNYALKVDP